MSQSGKESVFKELTRRSDLGDGLVLAGGIYERRGAKYSHYSCTTARFPEGSYRLQRCLAVHPQEYTVDAGIDHAHAQVVEHRKLVVVGRLA